LEEGHVFDTEELIKGRRSFFPEGDKISQALVAEFTNSRKSMYEERKDRRRLLRNGALFFVAVFIIDFYVSAL
jgi:hypothetical protein